MPSQPPTTVEDILATATIDPAFAAGLEANPRPPSSSQSIEGLKKRAQALLKPVQQKLAASRPAEITEAEHTVRLRDGWTARIIVCHLTADLGSGVAVVEGSPKTSSVSTTPTSPARPLILLLHGGGHVLGYPELQVPLARALVRAHSAVVVCASYRLAPEFPFPFSILDSWEVLQFCASEARKSRSAILPACVDARVGFIVGGESAGANLSASLAHLARDQNLVPQLTGQMLMAGTYICPQVERLGERYKPRYLSRDQNAAAPILDRHTVDMLIAAFQPDPESKLCYPFDQHDPRDRDAGADGSVKHGHLGLCPAYFQVCGFDPNRDDGLIYETVLREECDVPTRLDLYRGWGHCWWATMPGLDMSAQRMRDAVDGCGWLLNSKRRA